jgi:hypothetical protein
VKFIKIGEIMEEWTSYIGGGDSSAGRCFGFSLVLDGCILVVTTSSVNVVSWSRRMAEMLGL